MKIEFRKSTFGYRQDCTLEVTNKSDGVHISVLKAEHPTLVNEDVIYRLVNDHRSEYDSAVTTMKEARFAANNGFLDYEVRTLTEKLERAKFAQKIARRNKIFVRDDTESTK